MIPEKTLLPPCGICVWRTVAHTQHQCEAVAHTAAHKHAATHTRARTHTAAHTHAAHSRAAAHTSVARAHTRGSGGSSSTHTAAQTHTTHNTGGGRGAKAFIPVHTCI